MHDGKLSVIERGVQLANSGQCKSMKEIRDALVSEGYEGVDVHLAGLSIRTKLRGLIAAARKSLAKSD